MDLLKRLDRMKLGTLAATQDEITTITEDCGYSAFLCAEYGARLGYIKGAQLMGAGPSAWLNEELMDVLERVSFAETGSEAGKVYTIATKNNDDPWRCVILGERLGLLMWMRGHKRNTAHRNVANRR